MTGTKDPDSRDELFVVLKSASIEVYRVWPKWEHGHTIAYEQPLRQPPDLARSSRSSIKRQPEIMVVTPQRIAVHCAVTGVITQARNLPSWYSEVLGISFIRDNTQIMIETNGTNDDIGLSRSGLIVDAEDLSIITYFACQEEFRIQHLPEARHTQYAYTSHPSLICNYPKKFTSSAGLQIEVEIQGSAKDHSQSKVVVKVTTMSGVVCKTLTIPAHTILAWNDGCSTRQLYSRLLSSQLVVKSDDWMMMWQLPACEDDEFDLLVLDQYYYWHICGAHQQLYNRKVDWNGTYNTFDDGYLREQDHFI
ncbi:hypothetical protein BGZ67_009912 [Mortierella alpina]|nr:hypothetical protein BGZ67_009912 [Mortierella alpina]